MGGVLENHHQKTGRSDRGMFVKFRHLVFCQPAENDPVGLRRLHLHQHGAECLRLNRGVVPPGTFRMRTPLEVLASFSLKMRR